MSSKPLELATSNLLRSFA